MSVLHGDLPLAYVRTGLALIPIPLGLKGPLTRGWQLEENVIRSEEQAVRLNGVNIGLAHRWCGTCAVDVDDYQQALPWLDRHGIDLQALLTADDAVQIRSGKPNRAKLLYRLPDGVEWLPTYTPDGIGLELRCASHDGATTVQDVLPPSIHPDTGKPYEWVGDWRHIPRLPDALMKLWRELSVVDSRQGPHLGIEHDPVLKALDGRGMVLGQIHGKPGGWAVRCPWEAEHTGEGGKAESAYFEPHTNGYAGGAFKCLHSHCANREIRELQVWLGAQPGDSASRAWPETKPIKAALHPVPAFDADTLLPEALSDWIMDEADRMPCPPDFIAAGVLVALGAIIGARVAIKPKSRDDWLIVPNLWGGIVANPSAKKSPAISAALKPLDRLIALAMEARKADMEISESEQMVFEARREAIEARIKAAAKDAKKGDPEAIARELQEHLRNAPTVPTLRRYKTNDSTIEKLGELLRENPHGLLVLRDELVGLLASWERQGREGDRAFFLEAWNGNGSFDTDRIGRGSIFVPNLCLSIFGGIQPDKLTAYLEQAANALENDGMLQRFQLLVYPDHQPWDWRNCFPARGARDRAFAVFTALADFDPAAWGATPTDNFAKFPYFRFDEAAQEIFIEWSANLHRAKLPAEEHPLIAQHLAKFDKLFPALALILHLAECAATGQRGQVSKYAALRAAAWSDYLEAHARRCYGLLADEGLRAAQVLADKARQGKLADGFTARDVRRNRWRYLTTDEVVQAALEWLEDEGWLRAEEVGGTGPGTGRRTFRYVINPKVKVGKLGGDYGELA